MATVAPEPLVGPRFCSACGKPLDAGANFCMACGAAVRSQQEVPQVAPAAAQMDRAPAAAQTQVAPAAAQTQVAPAAAQRNLGVPIAGREGPLHLTLTSHPGAALTTDGDCCIPFPPPVFMLCCSGVLLGDENNAMKVVYKPANGRLLRPDACYQRIYSESDKFVPDSEVCSFHCGCFDCDPNESWTLYSDGTIHSKHRPEMVLGARDKDGKLILVRQEDHWRRLVFKEVLAMDGSGWDGQVLHEHGEQGWELSNEVGKWPFKPHQSADRKITAEKTAIVIKQKFFSFSGNDFAVKNHRGEVLYKVKGSAFSINGYFRDRMVIYDANDQKVCVLQKKLMSLHNTFQIYTYEPNSPNQPAAEKDDKGLPIYRFAVVEKQIMSITPEFAYKLYTDNETTSTVLLAKVEMSLAGALQFKMNIKDTKSGRKVGHVGESSLMKMALKKGFVGMTGGGGIMGKMATGTKSSTYHLEVHEGMDILGMLCLACAVDEMREAKAKKNKKKGKNKLGLFV